MIPYGRQEVSAADIDAVRAALESELLTTGPRVEEFESLICQRVKAPHCVAVSSGTAALHAAYASIGFASGDEVICPPNTFIATQSTASQMGATIVFADVLASTGNINPAHVAHLISDRTKAVVGVDYAGNPCDVFELRAIIEDRPITLIQDASHSFGSLAAGQPVGSLADITTFSFFPTKNFTTGEGGAAVCLAQDVDRRMRRFARQGLVRDSDQWRVTGEGAWHQEVQEFGLNYRLPDILCALGISQLSRFDSFATRRAEIKAKYDDYLSGHAELQIPAQADENSVVWHLYPLRVPGNRRRDIFDTLRSKGVGVQVNYMPVYWHPVYADMGYSRGLCPVAEEFYAREISLPMHVSLSDGDVRKIAEMVLKAVDGA